MGFTHFSCWRCLEFQLRISTSFRNRIYDNLTRLYQYLAHNSDISFTLISLFSKSSLFSTLILFFHLIPAGKSVEYNFTPLKILKGERIFFSIYYFSLPTEIFRFQLQFFVHKIKLLVLRKRSKNLIRYVFQSRIRSRELWGGQRGDGPMIFSVLFYFN